MEFTCLYQFYNSSFECTIYKNFEMSNWLILWQTFLIYFGIGEKLFIFSADVFLFRLRKSRKHSDFFNYR